MARRKFRHQFANGKSREQASFIGGGGILDETHPPDFGPTRTLPQGRIGAEEGGGSEGWGGWGVTLLLDNCSVNGFGTRKKFWPMLVVGCGWLLLIPAALWMGAYFLVLSGCLLLIPGALWTLYRSLRLSTASQRCAPKKVQH